MGMITLGRKFSKEDARISCPKSPSGDNELPFGETQCRGTGQPSHWGNTADGQCHRDGQDASIDQRNYEDDQHQAREGQQDEEEERGETVEPAPYQASDHS